MESGDRRFLSNNDKTALYTSPDSIETALLTAQKSIASDMPILMYGSGDVAPSKVEPEAVRILSELTTNFIVSLVSAAMKAHDLFTDGKQQVIDNSIVPSCTKKRKKSGCDDNDAVCQGLDIRHIRGPPMGLASNSTNAITTKSFIFPICHDALLYGKVLDIQAARRDFAHDILDKVTIELVNKEGGVELDIEPSVAADIFPTYH
jgi:hypothetical protein